MGDLDSTIKKGSQLLKKSEEISEFVTRFNSMPMNELKKFLKEINSFGENLKETKIPKDKNQLIESELKRRFVGMSYSLQHTLVPKSCSFEDIIKMHYIPQEDLDYVEYWLKLNKEKFTKSTSRLFNKKAHEDNYSPLSLFMDVPILMKESEKFAEKTVLKYHKSIGGLLQKIAKTGKFLSKIKAVPTMNNTSYVVPKINLLALSAPCFLYFSGKGEIKLNELELIECYGHEGMGHALNNVITQSSKLPEFLKDPSVEMVTSTMESVAQFYEEKLLEDIKNNPEIQKKLGIKNKFKKIYDEFKDKSFIEKYQKMIDFYSIIVLADKNLGDPLNNKTIKKKVEMIVQYSNTPQSVRDLVESSVALFDSEGNLEREVVRDLIYCARPVDRALKEFEKKGIHYDKSGRSTIDRVLLVGFWSPEGFVDNARLIAEGKMSMWD
jgi:hypothetical protein